MTKHKKINKNKAIFVAVMLIVVISLFLFITFSLHSLMFSKPEVSSKKKEKISQIEDKVSFVAVGDNIIHEKVFQYANHQASNSSSYNFKPCYQNIKKYIKDKDLAFINQETIIAGNHIKIQGYPVFNSPESLINDLEDTGFNLVNTATNHSMDHEISGLFNSCKIWRQHSDITMAGIYDSQEDRDTIRIIEKNNIKFSFLSYTFGVNEYSNYNKIKKQLNDYPYALAQFDDKKIEEDISKAKQLSDVVIVSAHWGIEGQEEITNFQSHYAKLFADLGVDVVIGTHNHLIQPIEWIEGRDGHKTLVVYSLGNFLSTMKDINNQLEGMISFDFVRKENEIVIENLQYTPLINHFNDQIVTIYTLKEYNEILASQHSILKEETDIISSFKNKVKSMITNKIKIEM